MFEFDPAKSEANKAKHGIDFNEAQALWLSDRLMDLGTVDYDGEERRIYVGTIDEKCWTAVVTFRGGRVRIISVRRSRLREKVAYEHG